MPTDKGYRNTYTSPTRTGPKNATGSRGAQRAASGKRSWQNIGGPAPRYDAEFRSVVGNTPGGYNQADYNAFAHQLALGGLPGAAPTGPGGPGGGGRYGGGGGGGGGGNQMTQAMFDAMVQALGRQGQPLNLPAFRGQNIAAFNAAPYTQAQTSLNSAVTADRNNAIANAQNTTNALQSNFRNDYANQTVTPGATQAPVGAALQATAGPTASNDANQQAAAGVNAASGDSQAAFSNLLNVLAANANQSQASRLNQVQMDRGTALNAIGAQQLGLGAGINQARANAQNQWAQQNNERQYQNSLMAQQWAREQGQANWQQRNQQQQTTLQPILDLIASTGGAKGINMQSLLALLGRAA
jgi:hypothetical protein